MNSKQSKSISEIQLPFDFEEQEFEVPDHFQELKRVTLELVEADKKGYGLENDYIRDRFCRKAKESLGLKGHPTKEELDYCFPDYDHTKFVKRSFDKSTEPKSKKPKPTSPPTTNQAEERLKKATKSEPEEKPEISEEDWEWIEKVNHDLGGRLRYAAGFTPQTLALDIEFNVSNHRMRLYQYVSLHCAKSSGVSSSFTIQLLAEKLKCSNRDIREAIKYLKKKGLALPNPYPKHYTKDFTFILPYVKELHEISRNVARLEAITGISASELWEHREDFGFLIGSGGECEAEGVSPPSSS